MSELTKEEFAFIRSLNLKVKTIGGEVTITWKNGLIERYSVSSDESGDSIYSRGTLGNPGRPKEVDCEEIDKPGEKE